MTDPLRGPTYAEVYRFGALLAAFKRARRAKRGKRGEPAMFWDLEEALLRLEDALQTRRFVPDPYRYFTLRHAKRRLVSEASFRDRVVHHALVGALEPTFEAVFHAHSYACRPGRGVHAAVRAAQDIARGSRYTLRIDVQRYFDAIRHETLLETLAAQVEDPGVLWLCATLMRYARVPTAPPDAGRGLPIGNLTSQFWANVYLDPVDRWMAAAHPALPYVRYMDDILVGADSKAALWAVAEDLAERLGARGLALRHGATRVAPVHEGIGWLGLQVFPCMLRLDRSSRARFARKTRRALKRADALGDASDAHVASLASLCGHVAHADTCGLRRALLAED